MEYVHILDDFFQTVRPLWAQGPRHVPNLPKGWAGLAQLMLLYARPCLLAGWIGPGRVNQDRQGESVQAGYMAKDKQKVSPVT